MNRVTNLSFLYLVPFPCRKEHPSNSNEVSPCTFSQCVILPCGKNYYKSLKGSTMQRFLFSIFMMFTAIMSAAYSSEECMLFPVSLDERCRESEIIVEGNVTGKISFRSVTGSMIYTAYRLQPIRVFKGEITNEMDFVVEGGTIEDKAVTLSPGVSLELPVRGIFFMKKTNIRRPTEQKQQYGIYAGTQGIITFVQNNSSARDPFDTYRDISALYSTIEKKVGKEAKLLQEQKVNKKDNGEQTLNASISSISPTTANAGKDETLTINGSGFGASYTGTANVQFKSADDGGSTWVSALASQIVSWSNTQIMVRVRTSAGTGQVRVTAVDGTQATSAETLTITYNLLNVTTGSNVQYKTWLQGQDGSGGMTFTFNTASSANTDAVNAFKRALQTWRCNTYVNFKLSESTTSISSESGGDGVNVIAFNDANLPAGALGVTYNYWSSCSTGIWYVNALDMIFRSSPSPSGWNFGPQATNGNRFDFESVCLHELGHAHQLGHVINSSIIMHYAIGTNTDRRTLNTASDIGGGNDVVAYSTSSKPCGPTIMTALNSSNCEVGLPPVANFAGTPVSGCAPLGIAFTDQSTNTPTTWAWDIDNNGSTDYTTQNINHTFTNPGTYSVKLTATNGNGTNSLTRTNYITVHTLPTARTGGLKRPCFGQQISLAATPAATGGTTPYSYSWNPTTGLSSATAANPTLVCNFTETRIYVLTVTDLNGCTSSSRDTIVPNPRTTVNAGSDKSACLFESIALGGSPTASNGTAPYTYSWSPTAGLSNPASANPSLIVTQSGTYIVTVTDAGNCINRDTINITLRPQPIASCGVDKQICAGGNVIIGGSPSASNGTPPYQYSWSPATGLNNATVSNPLANPSQSTKYILTVTDANTCTDTDTIIVTVNPLPQPIITNTGSLNVCEGDSIVLSTGDFVTYSWSNGMNTKSIKVSSGGQYTVTVTNANNCTATSPPVTVTILPKPNPTITALRPASFCEGDSTVLDAGAGFNTYLWSNGASSRTITAKQTGSYYVTVKNAEGCSAQSQTTNVISKP